jgi:hypothetical protein
MDWVGILEWLTVIGVVVTVAFWIFLGRNKP